MKMLDDNYKMNNDPLRDAAPEYRLWMWLIKINSSWKKLSSKAPSDIMPKKKDMRSKFRYKQVMCKVQLKGML
jgi:hypothetical protein